MKIDENLSSSVRAAIKAHDDVAIKQIISNLHSHLKVSDDTKLKEIEEGEVVDAIMSLDDLLEHTDKLEAEEGIIVDGAIVVLAIYGISRAILSQQNTN